MSNLVYKRRQFGILWLGAMLVAVVGSEFALRALVKHSHAWVETWALPAPYADLNTLLRMPIPVTNKVDNGWAIMLVILALVAVLAFCGRQFANHVSKRSSTPLILSFLIVGLALLFFPISLSADPYLYVIYGRLYGLHHVNPYYLPLPLNTKFDPVITQCLTINANPPWVDTYGPLWTLFAGATSRLLAGATLLTQVLALRLSAVIFALIGILGLRYKISRVEGPQHLVARYAFHPLLLFEAAVGAHNDTMMLALAIWAFALVADMPLLAGLLLGAAIAVKYVAIIALPFFVLRARASGWPAAVGAALVALVVVALAMQPFRSGQATAHAASGLTGDVALSPTWIITYVIDRLAHIGSALLPDESIYNRAAQLALIPIFLAIYLWTLLRSWKSPRAPYLWFAVAALLWVAPRLNPWYVLWLLPAIVSGESIGEFAWWFGILIFLRYAGDTLLYIWPEWQLVLLTIVMFGAPVVLAYCTRRIRILSQPAASAAT